MNSLIFECHKDSEVTPALCEQSGAKINTILKKYYFYRQKIYSTLNIIVFKPLIKCAPDQKAIVGGVLIAFIIGKIQRGSYL